nr:uncharacterized protein CTRU02_00936 [Colletotrichum truncatum]KAF6800531.1 hypothetical protein CTRU02_00936 [Colletotrichum truncatum]
MAVQKKYKRKQVTVSCSVLKARQSLEPSQPWKRSRRGIIKTGTEGGESAWLCTIHTHTILQNEEEKRHHRQEPIGPSHLFLPILGYTDIIRMWLDVSPPSSFLRVLQIFFQTERPTSTADDLLFFSCPSGRPFNVRYGVKFLDQVRCPWRPSHGDPACCIWNYFKTFETSTTGAFVARSHGRLSFCLDSFSATNGPLASEAPRGGWVSAREEALGSCGP